MKPHLVWAGLSLILAGCGGHKDGNADTQAGRALEAKAIESGILPDPNNLVLAGRYETRSELGSDKFCAVKNGNGRFRVGALAVFGPESKCEAQGTASIIGGKVRIQFEGKEACAFDGEYDGIGIRFAGAMPRGCLSYCTPRASFSGTSYYMVEQGDDNARKTLGRDIANLCG